MRVTLTGLVLLFAAVSSLAAQVSNEVVTVDGVTYSNVTWGTVTPASATLIHSTGVVTVPLERLPPNLQQRFGDDSQRAVAFREAEAKRLASLPRLDREQTSRALEDAVRNPWFYSTFESQVRRGDIKGIQNRYKRFRDLQKTGHASYQAAIRLFIYACKRGIDRGVEAGKLSTETRVAAARHDGYRVGGGMNTAQIATKQQLAAAKIKVDAHNERLAGLAGDATKAWNAAVDLKQKADVRYRPRPAPSPKPRVPADPYLRDLP